MTIRVTHIFAASMANGISSIVTPISHPPINAPEIRAPPDQGALDVHCAANSCTKADIVEGRHRTKRRLSGVACAVLIRTVCADSARVTRALVLLPASMPAEMPAAHHETPEGSAHRPR
jgi:hypothetical protein